MSIDPAAGQRGGKHRAARQPGARVRLLAATALVLLGIALAVGWWVTGGRWLSVDTPSMGEAAPVGTLVLTRPVELGEVRVGDIISFQPPEGGPIHTHRVSRVEGGAVFTKGDINGAEDPWPVAGDKLVGKVVARWWGMAWVVRSLPIVVPGVALVWLLTTWAAPRWRTAARLVGVPLVLCAAILVLRPLVNASLLMTLGEEGTTTATVVGTGVLPVRVADPDGVSADLRAGQVAELVSHAADATGEVPLSIDAHMSWLWWTVCLGLCCVPLGASLALGRRVAT
ncbi:hypothetical protein [Actinokineospora diospyrosa]|uniref:Signal peptidase I n=1 Tax=Actinokineospora diospyrosa TaxID=103728 RepID=A0ABT1ILM0_9PSEU|nr:hypothetical protein [Actinokineospora diospyrosa]MCP2273553.1 signal peptidase I [Actinokineospora diospyrosa]